MARGGASREGIAVGRRSTVGDRCNGGLAVDGELWGVVTTSMFLS